MSEKKKKEGKLVGLFENLNLSVSSVSRSLMSDHAGPASPSVRALSPAFRNEMTTFYEAFRTPTTEETRSFATPSSQSNYSTSSKRTSNHSTGDGSTCRYSPSTYENDFHSILTSLNYESPKEMQLARTPSIKRYPDRNSGRISDLAPLSLRRTNSSSTRQEENHLLRDLTEDEINKIFTPSRPAPQPPRPQDYVLPEVPEEETPPTPKNYIVKDLTLDQFDAIYGLPPRSSISSATSAEVSKVQEQDDLTRFIPKEQAQLVEEYEEDYNGIPDLGISGEIQIYHDISEEENAVEEGNAVEERSERSSMLPEEGRLEGLGLQIYVDSDSDSDTIILDAAENREADEEFSPPVRHPSMYSPDIGDIHFGENYDEIHHPKSSENDIHGPDEPLADMRLNEELIEVDCSESLSSPSIYSEAGGEVAEALGDVFREVESPEIIQDTSALPEELGARGAHEEDVQRNRQLTLNKLISPSEEQLDTVVNEEIKEIVAEIVEGDEILGLGINFYDHRGGIGPGKVLDEAEAAALAAAAAEQKQKEEEKPQEGGRSDLTLDVGVDLRIPATDEAQSFQRPSPLKVPSLFTNSIEQTTNLLPNPETPQSPSKFDYKPFINSTDSPDSLIDDLLEENYRGQAETFVRKLSRSPSAQSVPRSLRSTPNSRTLRGLRSASSPAAYTPTRRPNKPGNLARILPRTPSNNSIIIKSYKVRTGSSSRKKGNGNRFEASPSSVGAPSTYGYKIYTIPQAFITPPTVPYNSRPPLPRPESIVRSSLYYFTEEEREAIKELVLANQRECVKSHEDCIHCLEADYAYYENKAMPTSMPPEERQQIINNNRSLRNIKNELENLAEHGAISDEAYDTIMRALPVESSLNGPSRSAVSPSPAPTASLNNLSLNHSNDSPPAYNNPTPPALPGRTPSAPPSKPELARATALYRYAAEGDCNFEVGDQISVTEYMNAEWWFGKNVRTGQEGVFPVNYVQKQQSPTQPQNGFYGNNEKASGFGGGYPAMAAQAQQGPPPPGPSNPYNSSVPPMAIANEPGKPSKGGEMGKKFGKKLGNAAIFGAGATIGGNIVNSIF